MDHDFGRCSFVCSSRLSRTLVFVRASVTLLYAVRFGAVVLLVFGLGRNQIIVMRHYPVVILTAILMVMRHVFVTLGVVHF